MVWGMIAAAAITAVASAYGAAQQNKANKAAAGTQMDFQERMSNTQYQRGMEDMRKAGLNPILAYKQGGASSPTGAKYEAQNVTGPAAQAAVQTAQSMATIENTEANSAKTIADGQLARQKARDHKLFGDGPGSGLAITADRLRRGAQGNVKIPPGGQKPKTGNRQPNRPRVKTEQLGPHYDEKGRYRTKVRPTLKPKSRYWHKSNR